MGSNEEPEVRVAHTMPTTPLHPATPDENVDTWSSREKLVLALSVATRGDQNWTGFRQTIKHYAEKDRPVDFFSNRSCATQYRKMLEEIEAPKRRREKKEDKKGRSAEEVPQELIIKKCKDEHLAELETRIKAQIAEYCEDLAIIEKIQSGNYDKKWYAEICKKVKREMELTKQKEQPPTTAQPPPTTPVKSVPSTAETVQPATPTAPVPPTTTTTTADSVVPSPLKEDKTDTASESKDETIPDPPAAVEPVITSPRITRSPEKMTSPRSSLPRLSSPSPPVLPKLRSPVKATRPAAVVEEVKVEEPPELPPPVLEDAKDDLADKAEGESSVPDEGALKTDTDEGETATTVTETTTTTATTVEEEVAVVESDKEREEPPPPPAATTVVTKSATPLLQSLKDTIAIDPQENSNDTIEEMEVDSVPEIATPKSESQPETPKVAVESKLNDDPVNEETPPLPTVDVEEEKTTATSAEAVAVTLATTAASTITDSPLEKAEEAAPTRGEKRKEPPTEEEKPKPEAVVPTPAPTESIVKSEEESSETTPVPSTSTLESSTKGATEETSNTSTTTTTTTTTETATPSTSAAPPAEEAATPAKRPSRRISRITKTPASSGITTRSTRSQSQIKVEQQKDSSTTPLTAGRGGAGERVSTRGASTSSSTASRRRRSNSIVDDTSQDSVGGGESSDSAAAATAAASAATLAAAANSKVEDDSTEAIAEAPAAAAPVKQIDIQWRKNALKYMGLIMANKHVNYFVNEKSPAIEAASPFANRLTDLNQIKKRINEGYIHNWAGLENELMSMYQNVYMSFPSSHPWHRAAQAMEELAISQLARSQSQLPRRPGRPSARLSSSTSATAAATATPEVQVKIDRRKTRGSLSVEKPATGSKKRSNV